MLVVAPNPSEVRYEPALIARLAGDSAVAPVSVPRDALDFPAAYDAAARRLAATLPSVRAARALLDALLLLKLVEAKSPLERAGQLAAQLEFRCRREARAADFHTEVIEPLLQPLRAAGLLANEPLPPLANEGYRDLCAQLLTPFTFSLHEADAPGGAVDPGLAAMLRERPVEPSTPRKGRAPQMPRRLARKICREALIHFLARRFAAFPRMRPHDPHARVEEFFRLPFADELDTDERLRLGRLFMPVEAQYLSRALLACRVCDPAVGDGTMLSAMLEELAGAVACLDVLLYGSDALQQHNYEFRLKQRLINGCLYGVDARAEAVRLCRTRLWQALLAADQSVPDASPAVTIREAGRVRGLPAHIVVGDSLLGCRTYENGQDDGPGPSFKWRREFASVFAENGGFDLLITRPPAHREIARADRASINALFPAVRRAKTTAAAFLDLPRLLGTPDVVACQLPPTSLTRADDWAVAQASLRLNYARLDTTALDDDDESPLDRELIFYRRAPVAPETTAPPMVAAPDEANRHLSDRGRGLAERLARCRTLGELITVKPGLRRHHSHPSAGESVPAIGPVHISQFRLGEPLPHLAPPAYLHRVLEELRRPKLVYRQTPTHIRRPHETLIVTCAIDRNGAVGLSGVEQIFPQPTCRFSLEFLCGLLNSSFARWFFHFKVFAATTEKVRLQPHHLAQLPVPRVNQRHHQHLLAEVEKLVAQLAHAEPARKHFLRGQCLAFDELDDLICDLFGLSAEERAEVLRRS